MKTKVDLDATFFWKEDIGSFVLKAEDGKSVDGFKQHYKELTHFGKHLLV